MTKIAYIDEHPIRQERVVVRVDFNVSLNKQHHITNDIRIKQSLPTLERLLKDKNKLTLLSHLGQPKGKEASLSLKPIVSALQQLVPKYTIQLIPSIKELQEKLPRQTTKDIFVLENIRFFPEEKKNDIHFSRQLASFFDCYVNDAFSVSHRAASSIVGIPAYLPHFGGLLLKKEIETIDKALNTPSHPFISILGGAKISSKIPLIEKLITSSDIVILGGGIANTFLAAQGKEIGQSLAEKSLMEEAAMLMEIAKENKTVILLPIDGIVADSTDSKTGNEKMVDALTSTDMILDIGPETQKRYAEAISTAKTIIWNGPLGYFENSLFKKGTDAVYEAVASNSAVTSIVGGGETLAALTHEKHLERITHISTGGGAMLEFVEKGTLPGIEALKRNYPELDR